MASNMSLPASPNGYVLLAKLGEGGFGSVYKAKKPNGDICALKAVNLQVLPPAYHAGAKIVWDKEVAVLVKTSSHRYIVSYHRSFSTSGMLWLEMEYCSGGSLQTYYESNGISRPLKRQFMIEISDAIDFLHGQQIIHRDLKPDNVLIQLDSGGNPYAKLADFGLAYTIAQTSFNGDLSQYYMQSVVGTKYYMAPEVYKFKYTLKADIFSLGVLYMTLIRETAVGGYLTNCAVDTNGVVWPIGEYMNMTQKQLALNTNAVVGLQLRDLVNSMILLDYKKRPTANEVNTRLQNAISAGDFDDNPRSRAGRTVPPP